MWFFDSWFATPTEKERDKYKDLYKDLNKYLTEFNTKLSTMESKVDAYIIQRPYLNTRYIPEDVYHDSEESVRRKILSIRNQQVMDAKSLSRAVDVAYQRYLYYARLAEAERQKREAEKRMRRE